MSPKGLGTARLALSVSGYVSSGDMDGIGGGADDPYANLAYASTRHQSGTEYQMVLPHFNKNDHPHNDNAHTFLDVSTDGSTWKETRSVVNGLSTNFLDLQQWSWRDGTPAAQQIPKLQVTLGVLDDDADTLSAPDDSYGSPQQLVFNILQIAGKVGGSFVPHSFTMPRISSGPHYIDLNVQVSLELCAAAIAWAQLVATGDYNVLPNEVPAGLDVSSC